MIGKLNRIWVLLNGKIPVIMYTSFAILIIITIGTLLLLNFETMSMLWSILWITALLISVIIMVWVLYWVTMAYIQCVKFELEIWSSTMHNIKLIIKRKT